MSNISSVLGWDGGRVHRGRHRDPLHHRQRARLRQGRQLRSTLSKFWIWIRLKTNPRSGSDLNLKYICIYIENRLISFIGNIYMHICLVNKVAQEALFHISFYIKYNDEHSPWKNTKKNRMNKRKFLSHGERSIYSAIKTPSCCML